MVPGDAEGCAQPAVPWKHPVEVDETGEQDLRPVIVCLPCYEQPPRYYSFPFPVILLFDHHDSHGPSHAIVSIHDVSHAIVF